jgi:hypothetical protein
MIVSFSLYTGMTTETFGSVNADGLLRVWAMESQNCIGPSFCRKAFLPFARCASMGLYD